VSCLCGCGEPTRIAPQSSTERGWVKGQPVPYRPGHNRRKSPVLYVVDPETGCWVWQRSLDGAGYGQIRVDGRLRPAHVVEWEKVHGPVPAGLVLDHVVCDNRPCVNPEHLKPATHAENIRRGRNVRLTWDDAQAIRALCAEGWRQSDVARAFGVAGPHVSQIVHFKKWPIRPSAAEVTA
jgi:hypothetical protein